MKKERKKEKVRKAMKTNNEEKGRKKTEKQGI